jgi:hypothetical protein
VEERLSEEGDLVVISEGNRDEFKDDPQEQVIIRDPFGFTQAMFVPKGQEFLKQWFPLFMSGEAKRKMDGPR